MISDLTAEVEYVIRSTHKQTLMCTYRPAARLHQPPIIFIEANRIL